MLLWVVSGTFGLSFRGLGFGLLGVGFSVLFAV